MQLFYFPTVAEDFDTIELRGDEVHHIGKVLRHKPGDLIHFTNGVGVLFRVEIVQISSKSMSCKRIKTLRYPLPYFTSITLALGIIKQRDRLEFAVEKAVEIGVGRIVLFNADRSERTSVNENRIQSIIESSMKQSLQVYLPQLVILDSVEDVLSQDFGRPMVAHEQIQDSHPSKDALQDDKVVLYVGPEGGFSDKEINLFRRKSAKIVGLGGNRLRAETASLVFLSQIHAKMTSDVSDYGVHLYRLD